MRLYFEQQWSSVTLNEKLYSREVQLKKSVSITKLSISVELTEKFFRVTKNALRKQFFWIKETFL